MTSVIACIPTRGRAWMIGRSIENLWSQGAGKILFMTEEEESAQEVRRWGACYKDVAVMPPDGTPPQEWRRPDYSIAWIGELRNQMNAIALQTDATHFLHICSDIWLQPFALETLLEFNKPIVAANARFSKEPSIRNFMTPHPKRPGMLCRNAATDISKPVRVDGGMVVACVLIERGVIEAGCRFGDDPQDEMAPFCRDAAAKGYELWWHPEAKTVHWMAENQVWMT